MLYEDVLAGFRRTDLGLTSIGTTLYLRIFNERVYGFVLSLDRDDDVFAAAWELSVTPPVTSDSTTSVL